LVEVVRWDFFELICFQRDASDDVGESASDVEELFDLEEVGLERGSSRVKDRANSPSQPRVPP